MNRFTVMLLAAFLAVAVTGGCGRRDKIIASFADANNARIGVMTGSEGERVTTARFPEARIKSFDDIMDAVTAIKSGQLDAVVTTFPTALQVAKLNPEFHCLPERLDNEETAIAIRKGDDELLTAVNGIISDLKGDGTLADMKRRWLKPDLSPYDEKEIILPTTGKVLTIGVSATREPLSFVDRNGRVTGHDGELARIIGARLHRPVRFANMKFMALIPALQSGKVDLILTGMTATDERRKLVNFTQPYFTNAQVMFVKRAAGARLASVGDLKEKRIGVLLGSVHDGYATSHYPNATILQYKSPPDLVMAVKAGKVDAALYAREMLPELLRGDDELGVLGESLFSVPIGLGFNRDNHPLREQCNRFLRQIRQNGVYDDMVERWMRKGIATMPDIPAGKTDGVLVVGNVSDKGFPFTVIRENRLIGFDVELSRRFAAFLGREIRFADMEFGGLIAAAATDKIDMIASTLMITEERKKRIAFSDPYYELGTSVLVLKENVAAPPGSTGAAATSPPFLKNLATSFRSNIVQEKRYLLIWDGLKTTVVISVLATIFGTLSGALVCFMRMSKRGVLNLPARIYIAVLRGTPVLVLLMLIFYVLFASVNISPILVAVIAFGMNFAAYVAEIFRSGIEGVDKGQTEAGIAMGFTRVATFLHIILPQTVRRILPVYKGEFISLVKMTSIVGYIAVQDLTKASDIIRSRTFDAFFPLVMVALLYFLISWTLMQALEYLERRTDPKWRQRRGARA